MPNRGELVILDRYIAETGKRGTALARIQTQRGGKRRKRSPLFRIFSAIAGAARPWLEGKTVDLVPRSSRFGQDASKGVSPFYDRI